MPVGEEKIVSFETQMNPCELPLAGVLVFFMERQNHRLITVYFSSSNHLQMQLAATLARTERIKEKIVSAI